MTGKPLSPKQQRFCEEYLVDLNATQAAIRAGYSKKTAQEQSSRLLSNVIVAGCIQQLQVAQSKRTKITADAILAELHALATVDISLAYDDSGFLRPLKEIPENVRRAILNLEAAEIFAGDGDARSVIGHLKKVRFHDKTKALELLGKHLKLFTEKHEHTGKDGAPIDVNYATKLSDEQLQAQIHTLLEKLGVK